MLFTTHWYILALAFVLDLLFGDPRWRLHPIRLLGNAISLAEPWFRRLHCRPVLSGGAFALLLIVSTYVGTYLLLQAASALSPLFGLLVHTVLLYFCLAARSLMQEAMAVVHALQTQGLEAGRQRLAWIVGREVDRLSIHGVNRAAVETVAENLVDGVMAPLVYAAIGGAPLAMAYKMVNTLDSMVGYKNETYLEFGRVAARIDDLANWLPARMSVPIIALAAWLQGLSGRQALQTAWQEGRNHASPNAGFPEAAFAGALAIRLGGPNYYHGTLVTKPYIGTRFGEIQTADVRRACRMMLVSSILLCLCISAPGLYHSLFNLFNL